MISSGQDPYKFSTLLIIAVMVNMTILGQKITKTEEVIIITHQMTTDVIIMIATIIVVTVAVDKAMVMILTGSFAYKSNLGNHR